MEQESNIAIRMHRPRPAMRSTSTHSELLENKGQLPAQYQQPLCSVASAQAPIGGLREDCTRALLAGLSGATAQLLSQPFKTVKVRLQNDRCGRFSGPVGGGAAACTATILREEGLFRGLYRGFVPGACRELLYSTCRFGLYRPLKDLAASGPAASRPSEDPLWAKLAAGALAGAAGSALANPADLVMVQMQVCSSLEPMETFHAYELPNGERGSESLGSFSDSTHRAADRIQQARTAQTCAPDGAGGRLQGRCRRRARWQWRGASSHRGVSSASGAAHPPPCPGERERLSESERRTERMRERERQRERMREREERERQEGVRTKRNLTLLSRGAKSFQGISCCTIIPREWRCRG